MSRCPDIDEQMSQKSDEQMSDEQVLHNPFQYPRFSFGSLFQQETNKKWEQDIKEKAKSFIEDSRHTF